MAVQLAKVARILVYLTLALFAAMVARSLLVFVAGRPTLFGFARMLDADREGNLLSWYASSLLLFAAMLLWWLAAAAKRDGKPFSRTWAVIASVFVFLSADEGAAIHELAGQWALSMDSTKGYLLYAWVVPWGALLVGLGVASLRLLATLPQHVRRMIFASGALFAGGAIGIEMIGVKYVNGRRPGDLIYSMMVNVEELMEMMGVVIFIYALSLLLEKNAGRAPGH